MAQKSNRLKKGPKQCKDYVGVACVDGSCPMALEEEYEERCIPVVRSCGECSLYRGCEDCALEGTEYCSRDGGTEHGAEE